MFDLLHWLKMSSNHTLIGATHKFIILPPKSSEKNYIPERGRVGWLYQSCVMEDMWAVWFMCESGPKHSCVSLGCPTLPVDSRGWHVVYRVLPVTSNIVQIVGGPLSHSFQSLNFLATVYFSISFYGLLPYHNTGWYQ